MANKFLIKTLVVVGICAVLGVTFFLTDDENRSARILGESLQQAEESVPLTGRATDIGENEFYIQVEYYRQGAEGNELITTRKKVLVDATTKVITDNGTELGSFNDIPSGGLVTVYVLASSFEDQIVLAQKIIIE